MGGGWGVEAIQDWEEKRMPVLRTGVPHFEDGRGKGGRFRVNVLETALGC